MIAGNYLAFARVLADSFFALHPDGSFTVLIVDDEERSLPLDEAMDRRVEWWHLSDLGLPSDEIHRLAGIYDVVELATSVKPRFLKFLMAARGSAVVYLDPDIRVFGSLAYAAELALRHGLVLTPHVTRPFPDDGLMVDALYVLAAGVYNLGFAAVGPSASPCLDWWWEQTRRHALNDVQRQMFTDQRWADYMPSLFEHHLLKDPGYNVAYWNLHERPLTRAHGRTYARNLPLRFFHFSGFDPKAPWLLSRHQGERPRILLSEHKVVAGLCEDYAGALLRAGFGDSTERVYGWGRSASGLAMTSRIRRLYWSHVVASERGEAPEPPDPFDLSRPDAFTDWLNAPDNVGSRRWSRYLCSIYEARLDLKAHVPDIEGVDGTRFAEWMRTDGVVQEGIPEALTPPVPRRDAPAPTLVRSPPKPGLNVTGYFHAELGVGEAARLLTRALDVTDIAYRTTRIDAPLSRQEHEYDSPDSTTSAPFDVNLLCLNADATVPFARAAAPGFFDHRHTVGYWFWEVDPLPAAMHGAFEHVDEVWAATDYVAGIVRAAAAGRKPVFTVPLPLAASAAETRSRSREEMGLPSDRFVFLFLFDFLSVMTRKNPLGAIEAFCEAFAPSEGPVLLIKSINGRARVAELEQLRLAASHRTDIIIRDGYVSADEKNALIKECDCYVSVHRAEGLGLTLAEAMAQGRPAIATGYSGNRHFMTDENSFLVDYQLEPVPDGCGPYPPGARWAEPDLHHAARLMREVYRHPSEAAKRAERGRSDLLLHHGVMSSASAISNRLAEIRRTRGAAALAPADLVPLTLVEAPVERPVKPLLAAEPLTSAAFEPFVAALPQLRERAAPHLIPDDRPFPQLRRLAQRAMFRIIRPYWFQQHQFQLALLDALQKSLERPGARGDATHAAKPETKVP